jgi:transcription elongation factor Elf1
MILRFRTFFPYTCPSCGCAMSVECRVNRRNISTRLACPVCVFAMQWQRRTWVQTVKQFFFYLGGSVLVTICLWAMVCAAIILFGE